MPRPGGHRLSRTPTPSQWPCSIRSRRRCWPFPTTSQPPKIVVKRIGGQPDAEDYTDFPIILVSYYGADYPSTQALASAGQVAILTSPLTQVTLPTAARC
jgi:hypothetical protein